MYYIVVALVVVVELGEPAAIVKSAPKVNAFRVCSILSKIRASAGDFSPSYG